MMRLIDADKLKKCAIPCEIHNGALTDLCVPLYQVDNTPTIYPICEDKACKYRANERPQGEWIFQYTFLDDNLYKCSICDRLLSIDVEQDIEQFLFCPNCGTDMRKENSNEK